MRPGLWCGFSRVGVEGNGRWCCVGSRRRFSCNDDNAGLFDNNLSLFKNGKFLMLLMLFAGEG